MTKEELKLHVEQTGSKFFEPKTMKFFGDTMGNYCIGTSIMINDTECWPLFRRKPVKHGLCDPAYFCVKTFRRVLPLINYQEKNENN